MPTKTQSIDELMETAAEVMKVPCRAVIAMKRTMVRICSMEADWVYAFIA